MPPDVTCCRFRRYATPLSTPLPPLFFAVFAMLRYALRRLISVYAVVFRYFCRRHAADADAAYATLCAKAAIFLSFFAIATPPRAAIVYYDVVCRCCHMPSGCCD